MSFLPPQDSVTAFVAQLTQRTVTQTQLLTWFAASAEFQAMQQRLLP